MANITNGDDAAKDDSPFPSLSDMDLDMWRAAPDRQPDGSRLIAAPDGPVCKVISTNEPGLRDVTARRIEMIGDLYEALRRAAEKMSAAGMDVAQESQVLSEFVTPKAFK